MPNVVTANVLRTGAIVYLKSDGSWVPGLADATVANDAECLAGLEKLALAAVQQNIVTAVYAFNVSVANGRPAPISVREKIRADGTPTV